MVRRDGSRERLCESGIAHLWKISEIMLAYQDSVLLKGALGFLDLSCFKIPSFLALVLLFLFSLGPLRY